MSSVRLSASPSARQACGCFGAAPHRAAERFDGAVQVPGLRKRAPKRSSASGWPGTTLRISRACAAACTGAAASNRLAWASAVASFPDACARSTRHPEFHHFLKEVGFAPCQRAVAHCAGLCPGRAWKEKWEAAGFRPPKDNETIFDTCRVSTSRGRRRPCLSALHRHADRCERQSLPIWVSWAGLIGAGPAGCWC